MKTRMRGNKLRAAAGLGLSLALAAPLLSCHAAVQPADKAEPVAEAEKPKEKQEKAKTRAERAKHIWFDEYYRPLAPREDDNEEVSFILAKAHNRSVAINEYEADRFMDYVEKVRSYGLETPETRKRIVESVVNLNAINPLLVRKYFMSLSYLAEDCEDDRKGFREAVRTLAKTIATEVRPFLDREENEAMDTAKYKKAVTKIDLAFQATAQESC